MSRPTRNFGCWPSTIEAGLVAGQSLRFDRLTAVGDTLYWSEIRPEEQGRAVLMRQSPGGTPEALLPPPFSARSMVHEYGGGSFLATRDELFFVNAADQDVWRLVPGAAPQRLTDQPGLRFADLTLDAARNRLIAVAEQHGGETAAVDNLIVTISLAEASHGEISALVAGNDFYAAPRLSPSGEMLAFLAWNLPHMPWEAAELHVAALDAAGLPVAIGTPDGLADGASFQPTWHPDGALYFVNDGSGFGQIHRLDGHSLKPVTTAYPEMEFGLPHWVFGMRSFVFADPDTIIAAAIDKGRTRLVKIDIASGTASERPDSLCGIDQLTATPPDFAAFLAAADRPPQLVRFDRNDVAAPTVIRESTTTGIEADSLSRGEGVAFENDEGETVHGFYYPPANGQVAAPAGTLPPVILTAHGGPTAFADCGLKLKTQFWTSRGFGWFDVNYSGSWGFGRSYRERLDGEWGRRDVADMAAAARHLVAAGLADPKRLLISGSSAGGYTVLMALARSDVFAAGASYYGISDLKRLRDSTHKFEAGYLDTLLRLNGDNDEAIFAERSPLHLADRMSAPVIFFQGLKDKVVPPDQAEAMAEALRRRGIRTQLETFAEEGHGFRRAETIEQALTLEYAFYKDVLGLCDES